VFEAEVGGNQNRDDEYRSIPSLVCNMVDVRTSRWNASFGVVLLACSAGGCDRTTDATPKSVAPAVVAKIAQEDQLNTVQLTTDAERRLGVTTAPVEVRPVERLRSYGGEITLPSGASIVVAAPIGGTLQAAGKSSTAVGAKVAAKQPIFLLLPLLSPERSVLTPAERIRFAEARNTVAQSQIDVAGQVEQAHVQVEAAKIALQRAERLLRDQAGTARAVDDAQAQLSLALKTLEAAETRKRLVDNLRLDEDPGKLEPLVIESPRDGILRAEHVAAGEVVAAGTPLFEVMDCDPVWVRVSVYAGEADELAVDAPALVGGIADRPGEPTLRAKPIAAPPTAAPLASAVDLYYELANPAAKFRPGERVTAKLVVRGEKMSPTIPWSAVVQDVQGGQWVYEQVAPQTFVRRRVQVRFVLDGTAVLVQGPPAGTTIVTAGAIELFGTEFGFAK
jgi:RND family efflux transporter MFP subunit